MAHGRLSALALLLLLPPESRSPRRDRSEESDVEGMLDESFDVPQKKEASADRLRRWRQAALMLNTSRHVRCTLDLKKEEEKMSEMTTRKTREHPQVIRAAFPIKELEEKDLRGTIPYHNLCFTHASLSAARCSDRLGLLGLFVSAPEVAIRMLRYQCRQPPFEPNFGRGGRKAGRGGGLLMGCPEPHTI